MKRSILKDLYSHYDKNLPIAKRLYVRMRLKIIPVDEYRRFMEDDARVLSLGCGYGLAEYYFAADMPSGHLTGLDIDSGKIGIARTSSAHMKNIEYMCMDVRKMEGLGAGIWDAVIANDLFHHIDFVTQDEIIEKAAVLLKRGGLLMIKDIHPAPSAWKFFNTLHDMTFNKSPALYYKKIDSYVKIMEKNGLDIEYTRHFYTLPFSHIFMTARKR